MKTRTLSREKTRFSQSKMFTNATLLTAISVAERGLGFLYRILLSRFLGAEGVGLYQVAISLFHVFLTVGTGGLPITLSRFISKHKATGNLDGERACVGAGVALALLLTFPVSIVGIAFPSLFRIFFADERVVGIFRVLLLGLSISAVYAVLRGSFWANKRFLTAALLEITEESVMVLAGVWMLRGVTNAESGAMTAAWAITISNLVAFTATAVYFFAGGGRLGKPEKQLKPLFNATLPITSVRVSNSLVSSAIAVLLPAMLLRAGATETEALSIFGILSGMVVPFLFIPATVIGSISVVLVPEISEDFYKNNTERLQKNITRGLQCAALIALFLIPFFASVGDDLAVLAFAEPLAGEYVRKGCVVLLPMSVSMLATSMLNAMGRERKTFAYFFAGAAAQLLCIIFLPKFVGGYAYVIGLGAAFLFSGILALIQLGKQSPNLYRKMIKPRGQGCVQHILLAFCVTLPLSLLGDFCITICMQFFSPLFAVICTALVLFTVTVLVWKALGLLGIIFPKKSCRKTQNPLSSP